jgi:hypothetical protein
MAGCMSLMRRECMARRIKMILREECMLPRVLEQILDQLGRVNAIIVPPPSKGQASNVCFGGPDLIYYMCCC